MRLEGMVAVEDILSKDEIEELLSRVDDFEKSTKYMVYHNDELIGEFSSYPSFENVILSLLFDSGTSFENKTLKEIRDIVLNNKYDVREVEINGCR